VSGQEEETERGKQFKIFFFLAFVCVGKKENNVVQNSTVSVFFYRKENVIGKNLKMSYDNC
jgi:hypothetical protein